MRRNPEIFFVGTAGENVNADANVMTDLSWNQLCTPQSAPPMQRSAIHACTAMHIQRQY
jgi:hypothetical protein